MAAFAGCRQEPLPESGNAIRFSVDPSLVVDVETKAGPATDMTAGTVSLYGTTTSGTVFSGDALYYNTTADAWTYSPLRYWIPGETYDFRAVFPEAADIQDGASAAKSGAIEVDYDSASQQIDLMVASSHDLSVSDTQAADPVELVFDHACAAVRFLFKKSGNSSGTDCSITSFKLQNVNSTGTMTYAWDVSKDALSWDTADPADLFASTATWTVETDFTCYDGWHYVLPQTLDGATVEYKCTFGTDAAQTVTLNLPNVSWEPGKLYEYQINITISKINVSIAAWTSYEVWVGDIPFPE